MSDERNSGTPTPPGQFPAIRSPNYRETYANGVRFRLRSVDITITLVTNPDIPGSPTNLIQDEVSITLTHPFLKILSRYLGAIVKTIEQELGPIKVPEANNPRQEQIDALAQALKDTKLVE
jgi:hypothetical protein